jgi:hypothetical protein
VSRTIIIGFDEGKPRWFDHSLVVDGDLRQVMAEQAMVFSGAGPGSRGARHRSCAGA